MTSDFQSENLGAHLSLRPAPAWRTIGDSTLAPGLFFLLVLLFARPSEAACRCWMCRFIATYGVAAWNDYLAGRWQQPETLSLQATPHEAIPKIVELLDLKPTDILYDLGCGDARVLIAAVKATGCYGVGIEIDPEVAGIARRNVRNAGCGRIRIVTGDARKYFLDGADAVYMYLFPEMIKQLAPKIEGAPIISYAHPIPGREQYKTGMLYAAPVKLIPLGVL